MTSIPSCNIVFGQASEKCSNKSKCWTTIWYADWPYYKVFLNNYYYHISDWNIKADSKEYVRWGQQNIIQHIYKACTIFCLCSATFQLGTMKLKWMPGCMIILASRDHCRWRAIVPENFWQKRIFQRYWTLYFISVTLLLTGLNVCKRWCGKTQQGELSTLYWRDKVQWQRIILSSQAHLILIICLSASLLPS